ncbi:hypothetical protein GOBAR_AA25801 [Gossypium barbadense]|uniref:K Homology domain-containing protein n=1 Tax=Gossypium barbadense TaxID=3634 RepID=A0A2P5WUU3_GOSBA|nr:hypothetical protein GOBAR_AA25801 [Gossypium barbadense]
MAEEEAVAPAPSPVPSDLKRKLEDVEPHDPHADNMPRDSALDPDAQDNDAAPSDLSEAKRPRLDDDKTDGLSENGFEAEKSHEPAKEEEEGLQQNELNKQAEDGDSPAKEAEETVKPEQYEGTAEETDGQSADNPETADAELGKVESFEADNGQEPAKEDNKQPSDDLPQQEVDDGTTITRKMEVPNAKVGVLIGKAGDTIRYLQYNSGAKIQIMRDADADRDAPTRPTVRPSTLSGGFNQQGYRPRGNSGPPQWGPRGHPPQTSYDYQQRGPYPSHNSHYQPPYGGYPSHQMAPRSNFGSSWEQRPHSMQGPPQSGGYDYYSRQGGVSNPHLTSIPGHGPVPSPAPAMGPPPSQLSYNYGQPRGPADYVHPPPYSQAAPQHGYGHGYEEKYENHTPVQHPYGGHGSAQPGYAQPGPQPGYAPQQQYGKPPSYGMQSQGPQTYGPPANQPGEVPYQGPTAQSYGSNVPPQQQYAYASSGPTQQSYPPYGSAPPSDGYSQPPAVGGQAYPQPGSQPVPGYSQPTAYAQASSAAGYGQYPPSQQGYSEQTQAPNNAGYGYQGAQDSGYGGAPAATYGAPPACGQATYAQTTAAQPTYDQSVPQSGSYAAAPGSAPAGYGKTVSPQPGYPQYDSTQIYAAPR